MTSAEAFLEFRPCLDTAMAMGLLDSAQLDELQARLAKGEEMIGRYTEANMRMTEGRSLEQELLVIKEQVQPTMASLKENDLVVQRENEELAHVEAQIADLQAQKEGPGREEADPGEVSTDIEHRLEKDNLPDLGDGVAVFYLAPNCERRVLVVLNFLNPGAQSARSSSSFTYEDVPMAECFDARRAQKALGNKLRRGMAPAGQKVAAGPAAHCSVAQSTGSFEQGAQSLRSSQAALDKHLAVALPEPRWAWTTMACTGLICWAAGYLGLLYPNDTAKAWSGLRAVFAGQVGPGFAHVGQDCPQLFG
ncbi:unnamed protein product [Prunus brigantina]